jgi:hypothetical protein
MAVVNCSEDSSWVEFNDSLRTNLHNRSIRFRLGEELGRYHNSIPNTAARVCTCALFR